MYVARFSVAPWQAGGCCKQTGGCVIWAMDPKEKKRKEADENRGFKAEWTESFAFIASAEGLPACLICNEKLSNDKKRVIWKDIFREGMLNLQPTTQLGLKEKV